MIMDLNQLQNLLQRLLLLSSFPLHVNSGYNYFCDTYRLSDMRGSWSTTVNSSHCIVTNTASQGGSVIWFGSNDGQTPDAEFNSLTYMYITHT